MATLWRPSNWFAIPCSSPAIRGPLLSNRDPSVDEYPGESVTRATGSGRLLLEPHTFAAVQTLGEAPATWYTSTSGLFSAQPHLVLYEPFWYGEEAVALERYYVIDTETGEVTRHASAMQAYTGEGYRHLLAEAGFGQVRLYPSLTGQAEPGQEGLLAIVAWR